MANEDCAYVQFVAPGGFKIEAVVDTLDMALEIQTAFSFRQRDAHQSAKPDVLCLPLEFKARNGHFVIQPACWALCVVWSYEQIVNQNVLAARFQRDVESRVKADTGSTMGIGRKIQ